MLCGDPNTTGVDVAQQIGVWTVAMFQLITPTPCIRDFCRRLIFRLRYVSSPNSVGCDRRCATLNRFRSSHTTLPRHLAEFKLSSHSILVSHLAFQICWRRISVTLLFHACNLLLLIFRSGRIVYITWSESRGTVVQSAYTEKIAWLWVVSGVNRNPQYVTASCLQSHACMLLVTWSVLDHVLCYHTPGL